MELHDLVAQVSLLSNAEFERWLKKHGYTGMAAFNLSRKRKEAMQKKNNNP